MSGQGDAGASVMRAADGFISKFHQRELFTALSIFVMLIGIVVTSASPAFVWTFFGWVFLILTPLYVLVMMCVRAFTRREWRLLGLSLNQVALVSSLVAGAFIIPVTLFDVLPYARFLPSGVVGGFVFALIGALGYVFFAAVAPFLAPFKDEFAGEVEAGADKPSVLARQGIAPKPVVARDAHGVQGAQDARGAQEAKVPSWDHGGGAGVAQGASVSAGAGSAPDAGRSAGVGTVGGGGVARGAGTQAPPAATDTATRSIPATGGPEPKPEESPATDPAPEELDNQQDEQTAFWFAVPETRHIVEPGSRRAVAALEPGMWILALEDRGTSFLVSTENGETGILEDISDVERA